MTRIPSSSAQTRYTLRNRSHSTVSHPKTLLVHRDNIAEIVPELGLPCVLKQPDSSFSRGVIKVETEAELVPGVTELLAKSALIIAQEWLPTGLTGGWASSDRRCCSVRQPLFRYYFPSGHWQVVKRDAQRRKLSEGPTERYLWKRRQKK